jgi:hypothetical protein
LRRCRAKGSVFAFSLDIANHAGLGSAQRTLYGG